MTHTGIGKQKKGRGPATRRQRNRRREAAERLEREQRARMREFRAHRYDR